MAVPSVITNSVLCSALGLLLLACSPLGGHGYQICSGNDVWGITKVCEDGYECCGLNNNQCCVVQDKPIQIWSIHRQQQMEAIFAFIVLLVFTCCCVCCYRCCCRRTTSRGYVYSTPGATTAVSVTLPPQQSQQVPYPTVVPYPQQTPYPPQYNPPTNPYYGMPPPAYGVAVQSGNQQASAPTAPYIHS